MGALFSSRLQLPMEFDYRDSMHPQCIYHLFDDLMAKHDAMKKLKLQNVRVALSGCWRVVNTARGKMEDLPEGTTVAPMDHISGNGPSIVYRLNGVEEHYARVSNQPMVRRPEGKEPYLDRTARVVLLADVYGDPEPRSLGEQQFQLDALRERLTEANALIRWTVDELKAMGNISTIDRRLKAYIAKDR